MTVQNRTDAGARGPEINVDAATEWAAFDALPPALRALLRNCAMRLSAAELLQLYRQCGRNAGAVEQIVRAYERDEVARVARERGHAPASVLRPDERHRVARGYR